MWTRQTNLWCAGLLLSLSLTACGDVAEPTQAEQLDPAQDPSMAGTLPPDSSGKTDTIQLAPGLYTSGVPTARFEMNSAPGTWGRQRMSQWCWAATSQMILNFHEVEVTQEDVVIRAYGGFIDRPANMHEIADSLNGWIVSDRFGQPRQILAAPFERMNVTELMTDLHFNQPVILGLQNPDGNGGHAYVLSAITYQADANGWIYPLSVSLRDPWPDHPGHITLAWEEVLQRFIGYVRIRATP